MVKPGSLRGLHYQLPPEAQALLLRALRGQATIAMVDVRRSAPSFGRAVTASLTYMGGEQLYIMPGFARSEEHTSELQSLMRISYAGFRLKNKKKKTKSN